MSTIKNILLGILLLLTVAAILFQMVAFDKNWYQAEFKILGIPDNEAINQQLANLLLYLKNTEPLENSFYTEKEILHLIDIKNLTLLSKKVTIGLTVVTSLLLLLVLIAQKGKEFVKTLFFSNLTALILYAVILILLYLKFDFFFILFHQATFKNDYWMLDPQTDNLINIFPPPLFADLLQQTFGLAILVHLAVFCLTGCIVVVTMLQKSRKV